MSKSILVFALLLVNTSLSAQNKKPEDYGFRHLKMFYQSDVVDILILSKKGDEQKPKPLFLFIQGSQPQPLIKYYDRGIYMVFPFKTAPILNGYHLAIVSKPYIPLIFDIKKLGEGATYTDSITKKFPDKYLKRNYLDYYVNRDKKVIEFLKKQTFIDKRKTVVAGHSEGSTVAAKLAMLSKDVTHLIYASGNPMGRISSMITKARTEETISDSSAERLFNYWERAVNDPENTEAIYGDSYKTTYTFSIPPLEYLEGLKIPILICYGTKDYSAPYNDYLRVYAIRKKKTNFTFISYIGLEHNFFGFKSNGEIDNDKYNWDHVAIDWLKWLGKN
jgi:dienelactone hydrolase